MNKPKRAITKKKYLDIQSRYKELYDVKRLRIDDCIAKIQEEFYISHPDTVSKILALELSE